MQPITMLPKLSDTTQTISFSEGDGICSSEVYASEVVVTTTAGAHNHGSSKVKLKSLVDYNWECKFYSGQLLATHMSGNYLAYSIKAPNSANPGSWSGMVRVVYNAEPGTDRRALIKGMKGEVHDLSFAHIESQVVLACIDEQGSFYIHNIELTDSGLRCTLVAEIREDTGLSASSHRVVWCPYIPDEDEDVADDDVARLLLTTHGSTARMWSMQKVAGRLAARADGGHVAGASTLAGGEGVLTATDHVADIVDAAFSPDGTALATASHDGYVMFFQVYMHNEASPRCLHKWQPHAGKPLSCLFFLDNHKNYNSDVQFWKFAVTGADNNTVLKIWSCKSWSCLQTITFSSAAAAPALGLRASLDTSAQYLLVSDCRARCLYVLHMARDGDDTMAYCRTISELLLPYPVLSFAIRDAGEQQATCESGCGDPYHRNGSSDDVGDSPRDDFDLQTEDDSASVCGVGGGGAGPAGAARVAVSLYIVQPKGLQRGDLVYTPPLALPTGLDPIMGMSELSVGEAAEGAPGLASSILQQQSQQLKNLLMRTQTQPGSLIGQRVESPTSIAPPLNLMTPDAFSSPGKREEDDPPLSATPDMTVKQRNSATESVSGCGEQETVRGLMGTPEIVTSLLVKVDERPTEPFVTYDQFAQLLERLDGVGGNEALDYPEETASAAEVKFTSAGSSPSREVQEIMSLSDDHYYKEHTTDEASQSPGGEEAPELAGPVVASASPAKLPVASQVTLVHNTSNTEWPQISIDQLNSANQREKSCHNSSAGSSAPAQSQSLERAKLDDLARKLDALTDLVTSQSRELRALRAEVTSPREQIEQALHAHTQRTQAAIESALSEGWERVSRSCESARAATATAGAAAAAAAGAAAGRALEPLAQALQHELACKLSATDLLLKQNIDKLVNSKAVVERLGGAAGGALAEALRGSLRDALVQGVVPVVEKAHACLFKQINHAFQTGTKEFAANTEAAARAAAERGGAAAVASLRAALDRHAELLQRPPATPAPAPLPTLAPLAAALADTTREVLEKEMSWWREQARSVVLEMSRVHSPATPSVSHGSVADRQMQVAQIQSLMGGGDVNGGFQLALSASDLSLVMAACRACDPAAVFAPSCRLKQHVLLSLVQQLAADMTRETPLKLRYLEEAIMNLDTSNPVTREHLPVVVRELQSQIMSFLNANPNHQLVRQFKMLLMATEYLLKNNV